MINFHLKAKDLLYCMAKENCIVYSIDMKLISKETKCNVDEAIT